MAYTACHLVPFCKPSLSFLFTSLPTHLAIILDSLPKSHHENDGTPVFASFPANPTVPPLVPEYSYQSGDIIGREIDNDDR